MLWFDSQADITDEVIAKMREAGPSGRASLPQQSRRPQLDGRCPAAAEDAGTSEG